MSQKISSKDVVFIHGLFQNPESWKNWTKFFQNKGYAVHTPAYPFHEGSPAEVNKNIDPALGKLTFGQVTGKMAGLIKGLSEKPVLIGHSTGGLKLVQKLLEQALGFACIVIDTAPPKGISGSKWSFLESEPYHYQSAERRQRLRTDDEMVPIRFLQHHDPRTDAEGI